MPTRCASRWLSVTKLAPVSISMVVEYAVDRGADGEVAVAGTGDHDAVGIGLAGEPAGDRDAGDQRADEAAGEAGELVAAGVEAGAPRR